MKPGRAHFVYRCYDAEGRCLYVGCTSNPQQRMKEHRYNQSGADLAVKFKVSGPYLRHTALELEKRYMEEEDPAWGMTPKRQRLIARGLFEKSSIYPPHRRMHEMSADSGNNSNPERRAA